MRKLEVDANGDGTALITGASRGIGYELARLFAASGYDLVLVARSEDDLEAAAEEFEDEHDIEATVIAMDLARLEAPRELYEKTTERDIQIDALVNNAGFASYGEFTETNLEKELDEIQLNVSTVTHLTKLYLRDMDERGHGKVLNVASTAAFQPIPVMSVYAGSKAYVLSFTEAIAEETDDDIAVTALCPGPVDTEFDPREDATESPLPDVEKDPQRVAREGFEGLMNDETVVIPGIDMKALTLVERLAPRSVTRKVAGSLARNY